MIDIDELTEEQIARAVAVTKIGQPLRRVKHGSLGQPSKIFLNDDETVVTYQSKHWSTTFAADHPKESKNPNIIHQWQWSIIMSFLFSTSF